MDADRRQYPRMPGFSGQEVQVDGNPARVADFSQGGSRLLVDSPLAPNSAVMLQGHGASLAAHVVACDYRETGWNGSGFSYSVRCQFDEGSFEDQLSGFGTEVEQLFGLTT